MDNQNIPEKSLAIFNNAEKTLSPKLLKYSEAITESLKLNDMNISDKSMVAPSIHHGFINCLFSERRILTKLKEKKEEAEEIYISRYGQTGEPKYKTQNEVSKVDGIVKLEKAIKEQQEVVRYLEDICRIMSTFNFSIKNAVELMKLG